MSHPKAKSRYRRFVDVLRSDFRRNPRVDSRITLMIWRSGQALRGCPGILPFLARRVVQVANAIWTRGVMNAILPAQSSAGPGLRLPHGGMGVVLHPTVTLGGNVTIYQQVTVGVVDDNGAASIGDDVYVGAGARILGPILVGEGAKIGANAVVVKSVATGVTVVGVPAREVG